MIEDNFKCKMKAISAVLVIVQIMFIVNNQCIQSLCWPCQLRPYRLTHESPPASGVLRPDTIDKQCSVEHHGAGNSNFDISHKNQFEATVQTRNSDFNTSLYLFYCEIIVVSYLLIVSEVVNSYILVGLLYNLSGICFQ